MHQSDPLNEIFTFLVDQLHLGFPEALRRHHRSGLGGGRPQSNEQSHSLSAFVNQALRGTTGLGWGGTNQRSEHQFDRKSEYFVLIGNFSDC